jgi:hypothetical protein
MWEPRRITTLWAFTARYRDSFTYSIIFLGCPLACVYLPRKPQGFRRKHIGNYLHCSFLTALVQTNTSFSKYIASYFWDKHRNACRSHVKRSLKFCDRNEKQKRKEKNGSTVYRTIFKHAYQLESKLAYQFWSCFMSAVRRAERFY